jgi:hypothetical protein
MSTEWPAAHTRDPFDRTSQQSISVRGPNQIALARMHVPDSSLIVPRITARGGDWRQSTVETIHS